MRNGLKLLLAGLTLSVLAVVLIMAPWKIGFVFARAEDQKIRNEIFEYVLENKDAISLDAPYGRQSFLYTSTGFWDASIEFGYYYSENDTYDVNPIEENRYGNGYRIDGVYGDPVDWYYTEKICDNWYYYELHDG